MNLTEPVISGSLRSRRGNKWGLRYGPSSPPPVTHMRSARSSHRGVDCISLCSAHCPCASSHRMRQKWRRETLRAAVCCHETPLLGPRRRRCRRERGAAASSLDPAPANLHTPACRQALQAETPDHWEGMSLLQPGGGWCSFHGCPVS